MKTDVSEDGNISEKPTSLASAVGEDANISEAFNHLKKSKLHIDNTFGPS